MNKKVVIGIIVGIALLSGVGLAAFFLLRPPSVPETPLPQTKTTVPAKISLTTQPSSQAFVASESGTLDLLINTNGVKVDGFQFIATLNGSASPVVSDGDTGTAGVQIEPSVAAGLSVVTNSVITQNGDQVVRYAMITQDPSQSFSSSTPLKVATIRFTTGQAGVIKIEFNTQNTRANRTGSTEETLITATSQTYTVSAATGTTIAQSTTSTPSAAVAITTPPPATSSSTKVSSATALSCNNACLNDNDCASGLSCINNACANAACPGSATCSCTGTQTLAAASATATPRATSALLATATPRPTSTPLAQFAATSVSTSSATSTASATITPRPSATATIAALPATLPASGSVENTIMLIASGIMCITVAAFFMLRWQ
jgi:hypothetical protein